MRVLLDTCILSELRRARGNPAVRQAVESFDSGNLFISILTIGEIAKGIALLRDNNDKRGLSAWLADIERFHAGRLLPVDLETARIWVEVTASGQKAGRVLPAVDGLIAATALRHGLHLMTRNIADFAPAGVMLINPWEN